MSRQTDLGDASDGPMVGMGGACHLRLSSATVVIVLEACLAMQAAMVRGVRETGSRSILACV